MKTQIIQALDSQLVENYRKESNQVILEFDHQLLDRIIKELDN
jgi:hypothetical protein